MKKKLLSLALFLLTVMSVQPTFAQTWVGDELAAGDFYLYNVGAKKFLYGANTWDTRGSLTEGRNALKCTLETAEEGKYAVSTASVYAGKYLGDNGFVDSGMFAFTITEVGEGTKIYTIDGGGGNLFGYDGTTDVIQLGLADATSENAQWLLISPESYMKIMTEWMEDASETNPKDVSCFLFNPDFKRNVAMWPTFKKADGGVKEKRDAANICTSFVELYAGWDGYTPLKLEQTVTGLPNGKYKVTCKGFFRNGETGTNPNLVSDWVNKTEPVVGMIYANDATSPLKSIFEGLTSDLEGLSMTNGAEVLGNVPNDVDQTHNWFATNVYDGNEVTALVTDGTLTLGVKTESDVSIHRRWICVDEFSLIYLGVDLTALTENLAEVKTKAEALNTENVNEATKAVLANAIAAAGSVEETAEALEKAIADLNQAILLVENMGVALQDANTVVATHESFETNSVAEESVKDTYKTAINNAKKTLDEAADLATVESAINSLEEARKVYVYAALPKEGETLDVTFLMTNPNGDNDEGWTFEGTHGSGNNQHWSGVTNRYLELCDWGKTGWEAKMSQNVELPRGRYIVSAYGRSEGSAKLELVAGDKVVAFPALGDKGGTIATDGTEWESIEAGVAAGKSFTNDGNGRGWTLAKAEAEVEESLTIGAQASTTAVHQWTSIDDFKLELVGALPDYSDVPTVTFDASAMANGLLTFVVASEKPYARANGTYRKFFGVYMLSSFAEEAPYVRNKETQEVVGGTLDKSELKGDNANEVEFVFDISDIVLPFTTYELVIPRGAYCCPETEDDYNNYVCSGSLNVETVYEFTIEPATETLPALTSSKDIQLRYNNTSQKATGATLEIREGSNDEAFDYNFCGLLGFDLTSIRTKMAEGFKVKDVQIVLTQGNQCKDVLSIQPFGNDWAEDGTQTTWASMETRIMESTSQPSLAQAFLPDLGKEPFELRDKQAVERYDITGYQGTFEDAALTAYVANALAGEDDGVSFLVVNTNTGRTGNAPSFFTKDATAANYGTSDTEKWAWNAESGAWEKQGDERQTRYQQMLDFFGMTEAEFQAAVAPKLIVTMEELQYTDVPATVTPDLSMASYGMLPFTVTTSSDYILANAEFDEWGGIVSLKGEAPYIVKKGETEKVEANAMIMPDMAANMNDLPVVFTDYNLGAGTYEFVLPKGTYCCPESKDDYMNCVVSGVYNAEHRYEFTIEPSAAVQVYESIPGYDERVKSVKEVSVVLSTEAALNTEADAPVAYLQLVGSEDKIAYTAATVNAENAKMITFTFDEITAEGDYNIIVPEKAFVTVGGDWNAEYMSQFEVNSHEAKVNGTVTPGEGTYETITMEQEFKVTFDAPVTLNENAPQQVIFRNRMAQAVAFMTLSENGTEATIKAGEEIEMMGAYTLVIPEETVLDADGNWNFEITATYTVTGKPAEYTMVPADGSEVAGLKEFTLTEATSCGIDYNCTETIKLYNSKDEVVAEIATSDFEENAIQEGENFWDPIVGYKIVLKDEITAAGTYKLVIPAGMFIVTANEVANEELTYTFAVNNPVTAEITPEAGTEFETITAEDKFTVEFSKDVTLAENAQVYFKPMMGRQRFAATMVVEGNKGTITPSVEIKQIGRYSLVIEAKAVTDAEGNWNAYTEVAYNVTGAPIVVTMTPADGATVTSLMTFKIEAEEIVPAHFGTIQLTDANDEVVASATGDDCEMIEGELADGAMFAPIVGQIITLNAEITATGTYTLTIPAGFFNMGENGLAQNEELKYTYIITDATGINAIFADGATADVYTLGGVLVKKGATREDVKSLKKGMYIINGKTVLLK